LRIEAEKNRGKTKSFGRRRKRKKKTSR